MIDYALWEVIENGATLPKTQVVEGVIIVMLPIYKRLKNKAQRDAKKLLEAVEKRFGFKIVSQLELLDEKLSQKDVNQKLLRSLSPEWNTHACCVGIKADLDTILSSIQDLIFKEKMESQSETTQTVSALKLPVLKTGDYDLWSMRMEQYLTHTDYALWEVIMNGDVPAIASANAGTEGPIPPKTAEEKLARKNELKAKRTCLLAFREALLIVS
ncbi:hypothetical protein Tco_0008535 [Tanacetum coccineum]